MTRTIYNILEEITESANEIVRLSKEMQEPMFGLKNLEQECEFCDSFARENGVRNTCPHCSSPSDKE